MLATDHVASAPPRQAPDTAWPAISSICKAAAAACDLMLSLHEVGRVARKANDHGFTMGVALSLCSLPHTRCFNFDIGPEEMEIGRGIHAEPGMVRGPLKAADQIVDEMMDRMLGEMSPKKSDRVGVLINSPELHTAHEALYHEPQGKAAA